MFEYWNGFNFAPEDLEVIVKLVVAAVIGSVVGLERVLAGKDPGLRTFMLVSTGSCLFSIVSLGLGPAQGADPARIAAQIVPGIGFLGAGAIFRSKDRIAGLTTAALMWLTASIGMAVGFGHLGISISALLITMTFMFILECVHRLLRKMKPSAYKSRHDFDPS
jgi:putative Mg2+ transporter-C (MgtC) family protein